MRAKAEILFEYEDEETAKLVATLLQIDNEIAPKSMQIVTGHRDHLVITDLTHERLNTFFATIDDLIFSTKIVEDILRM